MLDHRSCVLSYMVITGFQGCRYVWTCITWKLSLMICIFEIFEWLIWWRVLHFWMLYGVRGRSVWNYTCAFIFLVYFIGILWRPTYSHLPLFSFCNFNFHCCDFNDHIWSTTFVPMVNLFKLSFCCFFFWVWVFSLDLPDFSMSTK